MTNCVLKTLPPTVLAALGRGGELPIPVAAPQRDRMDLWLLSNTLSLLKHWYSLVATLTCPTALTTTLR
ncbi:hypothetical protein A5686_19135 [Mycobacterium sp. E2479]|nr:hypothetical protein A5686_19135 [Mycobacterium sp. E2479]